MAKASETMIEAERLVEYRHENAHFLVKWIGRPTSDNTWEPKEKLPSEMAAAYVGSGFNGNSSAVSLPPVERVNTRAQGVRPHTCVRVSSSWEWCLFPLPSSEAEEDSKADLQA